jgi:glycosyltransferase involved in cell wall biosynthesis
MNKNKSVKTIAFFSAFDMTPDGKVVGGIETYTRKLANQLLKLGINVILVSCNYKNLSNYEIDGDLNLYRLPCYGFGRNRYPIPKKGKLYQELIEKIQKEPIDAIICNARYHLPSHIGAAIAKKKAIPLYIIEHNSAPLTLSNPILDIPLHFIENKLSKRLFRQNYPFVAISTATATHLKNKYGVSANYIWYNNVSPEDIQDHSWNNTSTLKIGYVGRILKQKGVGVLLDAFTQVFPKEKFQLDICGDGPDLVKYKREYASDKNIFFHGRISREDVRQFYKNCDVIVLVVVDYPEGLNGVVLEAGASGCCVVTTDTPGINEIIEDKITGYFVPVNDSKALSERLMYLLQHRDEMMKMGDTLQKKIQEKFTSENVAKKLLRDILE